MDTTSGFPFENPQTLHCREAQQLPLHHVFMCIYDPCNWFGVGPKVERGQLPAGSVASYGFSRSGEYLLLKAATWSWEPLQPTGQKQIRLFVADGFFAPKSQRL